MRTQIGIVGAGPAGLLLAHLLRRDGIESVVLENRSRQYVIERVRAGLLEQGTVDLMDELGLADRLHREGLVHHGLAFRFNGKSHRVPLTELTGKVVTIYGQNEVMKDLIDARLATGDDILERLVDLVQLRARERAQRFVGRTIEVLVEGSSRTDPSRLRGRTRHNKAVNFEGTAEAGELVEVEIAAATSQTLSGHERLLSRAR